MEEKAFAIPLLKASQFFYERPISHSISRCQEGRWNLKSTPTLASRGPGKPYYQVFRESVCCSSF
jgi:hypothetical protein